MSIEQQIRGAEAAIRNGDRLGEVEDDGVVLAIADLLGAIAKGREVNPEMVGRGLLEALILAKLLNVGKRAE
jgi:hypothetical protein